MADSVNAVAGSTVRPEWATPLEQTGPTSELGKDEFLQLLVAQLKYQDPLEPTSSDEFISTTAQFTVIEKLDELTRQGANSALVTSLTTAGNLVGREVTANRDGVSVTAVVERSGIVSGEVVLETAEGEIALNQIVSIGSATTGGATPTVDQSDGLQPDVEPVEDPGGLSPAPSEDVPDDLVDAFLDEETAAAAGHGPDLENETDRDLFAETDNDAARDGSTEYVDGVGFVEVVGGDQTLDSRPVIPVVQQVEPVQVIQPLVIVGVPEASLTADGSGSQPQLIGSVTAETLAALAPEGSEPDRLEGSEPDRLEGSEPDRLEGSPPVLDVDDVDEETAVVNGSDSTIGASASSEPTS